MLARITLSALGSALLFAAPLAAQNAAPAAAPESASAAAADSTVVNPRSVSVSLLAPKIEIQNLRPADQRGINMFEAPKETTVPFTGFKLNWGAAFTQQFQSLDHENTAAPRLVGTPAVDRNRLIEIGNGFNTATANLNLNAQLAPGIRVALTSYLSSRHHNETWVKDGYLLVDGSPVDFAPLHKVMEYVTVKAGHYEINYGDAHFRRTDNGNAMYNPFVGNLILDAFTTQIGGEVYVRSNGLMAMGAITGGEIKGAVTTPSRRSPAFYGKAGLDRQLTKDLRVRLMGSAYGQAKAANQTLYSGDRAGSRYYAAVDTVGSTLDGAASSGLLNPGFNKVKAYMINPFIKYRGLELFGTIEQSKGRMPTETVDRTWNQYAGEAIFRFAPREQLYVGARYNTVEGRLRNMTADVGADRSQIGAGWFITPIVLLKGEYVTHKYNDFPTTDHRSGGKFNGFVVEGVVAF
jgi:hypothetical protein